METNNKLREALKTLLNLAYEVQDANSEYGPKTSVPAQFIIDVAKPALAEPVKNCEVGTAGEQHTRFRGFCRRMSPCSKCPVSRVRTPSDIETSCAAIWAQMSYESEEGGAK